MRPCNSIQRARLKAAKVAGGVLVVALGHAIAQLLLYQGRVMGDLHAGDFALFAVPALIAWLAYLMVFTFLGGIRSLGASTLAFGASCLSFWAGMIATLNTYGS